MTAAPRKSPSLKLHYDDYFWRDELVTSEARPMPFGKKREKHRRGAAGYGSKLLYKDCGDNVGKLRHEHNGKVRIEPAIVRNCTKDEGRSFEAILQGKASNHLKLLWSKAMVVRV